MPLSPTHTTQLTTESGLTEAVIRDRGYQTITNRLVLAKHGFGRDQQRTPGLLIPLWGVNGTQRGWQLRPDTPRETKAGRVRKYELPAGSRMMLDCHPSRQADVANPQIPCWVTEGVKKADALTSVGELCLGLMGVWNWRGKNIYGGLTALPDWEHVALNGRTIYIVFDNDVARKPEVLQALRRLFRWLEFRKAHPRVVWLPVRDDKLGVDDALVEGLTVADLQAGSTASTPEPPEITIADTLTALSDEPDYLRTTTREIYAIVTSGLQRRVVEIVGGKHCEFTAWLTDRYFKERGKTVARQTLDNEIHRLRSVIAWDADCPIRPVFTRLGEYEGTLYLDLGDEAGLTVAITAEGWQVVIDVPVVFRRPPGLLPLPIPTAAGDIRALRPFLPVQAESDEEQLLWAWLLQCLNPEGPYMHLVLHGEQGSGKSFLTKILRMVLDPNIAGAQSLPEHEHDLVIAARNGRLLCLENVSDLELEHSDWLCKLATGSGIRKRKLHTDDQEIVQYVMCPVVINGINNVAMQGDLRDRAILLELIRLPAYAGERQMLAAFREAHPGILGALCDAVVAALSAPEAMPAQDLRMADAWQWILAGCGSLRLEPETLVEAFRRNQQGGAGEELESSSLARALLQYLEANGGVAGVSASDLWLCVRDVHTNYEARRVEKDFPGSAQVFSKQLRRLTDAFRKKDWTISYSARTKHQKSLITIAHMVTDDHAVTLAATPPVTTQPSEDVALPGMGDRGDRISRADANNDRSTDSPTSISFPPSFYGHYGHQINKNNKNKELPMTDEEKAAVTSGHSVTACPACGSTRVIRHFDGRLRSCVACSWIAQYDLLPPD